VHLSFRKSACIDKVRSALYSVDIPAVIFAVKIYDGESTVIEQISELVVERMGVSVRRCA